MNEQSALIEKILRRLINYVNNNIFQKFYKKIFTFFSLQDNVIIKLDKTGFMGEDKETLNEADPILVVHPNYVPGE